MGCYCVLSTILSAMDGHLIMLSSTLQDGYNDYVHFIGLGGTRRSKVLETLDPGILIPESLPLSINAIMPLSKFFIFQDLKGKVKEKYEYACLAEQAVCL